MGLTFVSRHAALISQLVSLSSYILRNKTLSKKKKRKPLHLTPHTTLEWSDEVVFYYHSPRVPDAGVTPLDSLTNTFL